MLGRTSTFHVRFKRRIGIGHNTGIECYIRLDRFAGTIGFYRFCCTIRLERLVDVSGDAVDLSDRTADHLTGPAPGF